MKIWENFEAFNDILYKKILLSMEKAPNNSLAKKKKWN